MYKQSAPDSIQGMFASIAKNYDMANCLLTFGIHKKWNNTLIKCIGSKELLLDLCAGTGEIAFGFLKKNEKAHAILLDFCAEMLHVAEKKGEPYQGRYSLIEGDAQKIPLDAQTVDAVSISYGIRNVKDSQQCFLEVFRVLKDGGRFAILELTRPRFFVLNFFHRLYLRLFLPLFGKITAKNTDAYKYLAKSVQTFISPEILKTQLSEIGFKEVTHTPLFGGIATIIIANKV